MTSLATAGIRWRQIATGFFSTLAFFLFTALALGGCSEQAPGDATPSATDHSLSGNPADRADLVITGARVFTANPEIPWAEAVAITGERIVAVGTAADMDGFIGPDTERLDGTGAMLLPGFIDSHVHFLDGGFALASVQLRDATTPEEFASRIGTYAETLAPGEWITNGDWDHENWGGELPRKEWVDALTPDNPVLVNRLDGHMVLANSKALSLAGVTADTEDVAGGEIVRDEAGNPTGVLKDNAMGLVYGVMPEPSEEQLDRALAAISEYVAARVLQPCTTWRAGRASVPTAGLRQPARWLPGCIRQCRSKTGGDWQMKWHRPAPVMNGSGSAA